MDRIEKIMSEIRSKFWLFYTQNIKSYFPRDDGGDVCVFVCGISVIHGNFRKSAPIRFFFLYKIEWNKMIFIYTAPRN
jgi:hypothetical protein